MRIFAGSKLLSLIATKPVAVATRPDSSIARVSRMTHTSVGGVTGAAGARPSDATRVARAAATISTGTVCQSVVRTTRGCLVGPGLAGADVAGGRPGRPGHRRGPLGVGHAPDHDGRVDLLDPPRAGEGP